jgi:hypothetical protein
VGFEPTNGGFADHSWFCILLIRLAFTPAHLADIGPDLGLVVPKLFPTFWSEPLRWHNFFGHSFHFHASPPSSHLPWPTRIKGAQK